MFRAALHSLLSALMLATLLWGGCIACPQFFMFPSAKSAKKDCCSKAGRCQRTSQNAQPKDCKRMPLELQEHTALIAAVLPSSEPALLPVIRESASVPTQEPAAIQHSPPDLNILHSTFVI